MSPLWVPLFSVAECPQVAPYSRKETKVEHEVTEAMIDTNYRRPIEGRSIDISSGSVHNIVVGSRFSAFSSLY